MRFTHDRRGQSVVIGTVILFGFLIVAMAMYQAQIVPSENADIEFEHSQEAEGDVSDVRNAILRAASMGSAQPQQVRIGTRYPQRTFFVNPPSATGRLETTDVGEIRIENVDVGAGAHPNVQAFWDAHDGFDDGTPVYETRSLRYTPNYNEYREAPTLTYEHSAVAAEFPNGNVLLRTDQTILRGDRISVTALSGDYSASGVEPQRIDPESISQGTRTIPITGGEDAAIVLPTAIGDEVQVANRWDMRYPALDVSAVEGSGEIRIAIPEGESYRLRLSEVAVDGTGSTDPAYVVPVGGTEVVVGQSVGVEVRDKYNNPVEDADVTIGGISNTTGDDGRVFREATSSGTLTATINAGTGHERVEFDVVEAGEGTARVFDTSWDAGSSITRDEGESETLSVRVADRETNAQIENAWIDYSIAPAENNTGTASISKGWEDSHDGTDTITFQGGAAESGDRYDLYVAAGDDVDRLTFNVVGPDPAGSVDVQNEIAESDGSFDVTTSDFENLDPSTGGFLTVENEDTGVETTFDEVGETTVTVDVADVGGITSGDSITGRLYETSNRTTLLDEDTTVVGDPAVGPLVQTNPASAIGTTEATLNGELTDLGSASDIDVSFQYRQSGTSTWTDTPTQSRTTTGTFDQQISGLDPDTTYEFRAVAESTDGSDIGETLTFTTDPADDEPPIFDSLSATSTNTQVTFSWNVAGDFDLVTLTTQTASTTSTSRSGSATIAKQSGNRQITATVEGPGGSETCEATIGNNGALTKDDFTCTTSG